MTYFAIFLLFCHFVYLFVCSFSAIKRSYPTTYYDEDWD